VYYDDIDDFSSKLLSRRKKMEIMCQILYCMKDVTYSPPGNYERSKFKKYYIYAIN